MWYEFRKGIVVGIAAAIVFVLITTPAQLYLTERIRAAIAAKNEVKPIASAVKNEYTEGHSLFHSDVEIRNPGPRPAIGAKILVKPLSCDIQIELESASTFPDDESIEFEDTRKATSDCNAHIVSISRLAAGRGLILHYVARSSKFIPTASPIKLLKVVVQDISYKDPLTRARPSTSPVLNANAVASPKNAARLYLLDLSGSCQSRFGVYTDADAPGNHFAATGLLAPMYDVPTVGISSGPISSVSAMPWLDKLFIATTFPRLDRYAIKSSGVLGATLSALPTDDTWIGTTTATNSAALAVGSGASASIGGISTVNSRFNGTASPTTTAENTLAIVIGNSASGRIGDIVIGDSQVCGSLGGGWGNQELQTYPIGSMLCHRPRRFVSSIVDCRSIRSRICYKPRRLGDKRNVSRTRRRRSSQEGR